VKVNIAVEGMNNATAAYVSPKLPIDGAVYEGPSNDALQSDWAMVFIALLVPALIAFAGYLALRGRRSTVRARISDYVTMQQKKKEGDALTSRIFAETEKGLERTRWWTRYKEALELADIRIAPVYIVAGTLIVTLFVAWLFYVIGGPLLALVGLVVPFTVRGLIRAKLARRRRTFSEQLPDNLDVLASALRAGHSLVAALAVVVNEAPEPSRAEFQRVVADEALGVPIEEALLVVGERMKSRDIEQVSLVASIQGQTGGNAAEVLDRVTESIRERVDLRRLVRTLTAQGRLARWIVSLLPVGLLVAITVLNPDYIEPLFTHTGGRILLVLAGLMIIAGSVVIGKIVDIEV
jgi:tight adherence protein B